MGKTGIGRAQEKLSALSAIQNSFLPFLQKIKIFFKKEVLQNMKAYEIMHKNERGTAIVIYSQFDLGDKYKVYTIRDGIKRFSASFNNIVSAVNYCDKIF